MHTKLIGIKLTPMKWFVVLSLITVGLALGIPPDPHAVQQLHTTPVLYRLAIAALLIPYIVIWYASFYAYAKLQEYTSKLKGDDGRAFRSITAGMAALSFGLVTSTAIALVLQAIAAHHREFEPATAIIRNYIAVLVPLLTFLLISNGTRQLLHSIKGWFRNFDLRLAAPVFILLCVVFARMTVENQIAHNAYHLNPYVLTITLVGPFIYTWLLGLISAYELSLYTKYVKGILYKQAMRRFARGIVIVIAVDILIQFVDITLTQRFNDSLAAILLIEFVLLILLIAGLALMALGTKKLRQFEEV